MPLYLPVMRTRPLYHMCCAVCCTCAARFAAVPNQSGQYRRVVEVLAQPMQEPYLANTKHGFRRGKPGTYLIQELEPEEGKTECYQWWLSPQQFRKAYAVPCVGSGRVATGLTSRAAGCAGMSQWSRRLRS